MGLGGGAAAEVRICVESTVGNFFFKDWGLQGLARLVVFCQIRFHFTRT